MSRINVVIIRLKIKIIEQLRRFGRLRFHELRRHLDVSDNSLDSALQRLRKEEQIHYEGYRGGWTLGKGDIFKANQRFYWRKFYRQVR